MRYLGLDRSGSRSACAWYRVGREFLVLVRLSKLAIASFVLVALSVAAGLSAGLSIVVDEVSAQPVPVWMVALAGVAIGQLSLVLVALLVFGEDANGPERQ